MGEKRKMRYIIGKMEFNGIYGHVNKNVMSVLENCVTTTDFDSVVRLRNGEIRDFTLSAACIIGYEPEIIRKNMDLIFGKCLEEIYYDTGNGKLINDHDIRVTYNDTDLSYFTTRKAVFNSEYCGFTPEELAIPYNSKDINSEFTGMYADLYVKDSAIYVAGHSANFWRNYGYEFEGQQNYKTFSPDDLKDIHNLKEYEEAFDDEMKVSIFADKGNKIIKSDKKRVDVDSIAVKADGIDGNAEDAQKGYAL